MRRIYATLAFTQIFLALTFPRAYSLEKLGLLSILMATLFASLLLKRIAIRGKGVFVFFMAFASLNLVSVVNGIINDNDPELVMDGLRLFVVFPIIFAFLWSSLEDFRYRRHIHGLIIFAAVVIFSMNFIAIFENYFAVYFLPASFVDENLLRVGIHEGYVQLTSHNIGSVYFIFGYIFYYCMVSEDAGKKEWFVLFLLTVLAIASGRRGLWLALVISPFIFYFAKYLIGSKIGRGKKIPVLLFVMSVIFFLVYFFLNQFDFLKFIERALDALSDDGGDIRRTQAGLMLDELANRPLFGTGIGGEISMDSLQRSSFELTYIQMLFSNGLILTFFIACIFFTSLLKIHRMAKRGVDFCVVAQSMFFGTLLLFIGAITNPYLGSFDFLLMIGSIPFLILRGFGVKNLSRGL